MILAQFKQQLSAYSVLIACVVFMSLGFASEKNRPRTTQLADALALNDKAQVIVLAAPSVLDTSNQEIFQEIVDFQIGFANRLIGRDEVFILVDHDTLPYYQGKVPSKILLEAKIPAVWIREFAPVIAANQVKFNYMPSYLSVIEANYIDNSFENWHRNSGLRYGKATRLMLNGGNVVDNGQGKAVVTERFLYNNPRLSKEKAQRKLKQLLGVKHLAIITEAPDDETGHVDRMLMWASENKILIHDQPPSVKQAIIDELEASQPGVELVVLPDYSSSEPREGFSSTCQLYMNSVVTNKFIYVPTFNSEHDQQMLEIIQSHTDKEVVAVPAEKICTHGGSVRRMSWQLDAKSAAALLAR